MHSAHAREASGKVVDEGHGAASASSKAEEIIEPPPKKDGEDEAKAARSHTSRSARKTSPAASTPNMKELRERLDQKLAEVRAAQERAGAPQPPSARKSRPAVQPITRLEDDDGNSAEAKALVRAHRGGALDTPIALPSGQPAHGAAHWDYSGPGGPQAWGVMKSDFALCSSGQRQSPIDIRDGIRVDLEPIKFDYHPTAFRVIDNGHTVQVNLDPGNAISVMGRRFELVQFHFHRPSEERINGRQFAMVAHLVHKDLEGKLAVVAVLIDPGKAHPVVQQVWNNLPLEKNEEQRAGTLLDVAALLPDNRTYYTYMGSLTTPPCSEGVLWMVLKQPAEVSLDQIGIFARLYPMNARPTQPGSGRLIKESN
jgi:carbonic anhydrase